MWVWNQVCESQKLVIYLCENLSNIDNELQRTRDINSLAPGKFDWNFMEVIFELILLIDRWGIFCEIAL